MGAIRAGNFKTVGQSNAQVVGGGLRFDSAKSQRLSATLPTLTSTTIGTYSAWVKRSALGTTQGLFDTGTNTYLNFYQVGTTSVDDLSGNNRGTGGSNLFFATNAAFRDTSAWYHIVWAVDTTQADANKIKLWVNGVLQTFATMNYMSTSAVAFASGTRYVGFVGSYYLNAQLSQFYYIDGQQLDPSYFGFTDPLTNTWRPKKYTGTYGNGGFYLPLDGSAPIGQDQSGKGNNFTATNFGGSTSLDKATGALPILNTDGGGKVARVGVRTDSNASSLVLALPLVGIKSDFSNAVNSGTSNKTVTINGSAAGITTVSNFYGGSFKFNGSTDYLSIPDSADWAFGTSDFTIELWAYVNTGSALFFGQGDGSSPAWVVYGNLYIGPGIWSYNFGPSTPTNRWFHYAIVRQGTNVTFYIDGVNSGTYTGPSSWPDSSDTLTIGEARSFYMNGYIQDFRIYKGLAKYTSNFIPASTDPDIVPDSPSGVSYSSNVALVPSTDGAVAFDGSGDFLNVGTSSDYAFGTGDYTIECFVYHTTSGSQETYFSDQFGNQSGVYFYKTTGNVLGLYYSSSIVTGSITLSSGRWYHIAVCRSSGTSRLFVNGVLDGSAADSTNLTQTQYSIGDSYDSSSGCMNGFISNLHIVKGTALYTANFTPPTGPISSVANTKLLCCKSNSSASAYDVSPGTITANGNAVASNFNPFTANIKTVRGLQSGYCTWNPLDTNGSTVSSGNLKVVTPSSGYGTTRANVGVSTGKWYWEVLFDPSGGNYGPFIGIMPPEDALSNYPGQTANSYSIYSEGASFYKKYNNATATTYGTGFVIGDLIGVAFDATNGTLECFRNGISEGVAFTGIPSRTYLPAIADGTNGGGVTLVANFGQKPFKFPPPAGFQPLTLANLPRPTIVRPDQYVGIVTYTGNGTTGQTINVGWKPDLVWIKTRTGSGAYNVWYDTVRGTQKQLASNNTNGDYTPGSNYGVNAFTSTGFSIADTANGDNSVNGSPGGTYAGSTAQYVAWCWKAGGNSNTFNIDGTGYSTASAAGLTAGTITPTGASVNTKSGFSIIAWTGTDANATLSHGLTKEPAFIIAKSRASSTPSWAVYHKSLGKDKYILLNSTAGEGSSSNYWGSSSPSSSLFGVSGPTSANNWTGNMIAYLWAEIPGFSKFGSYTGDGSTSGFGPFIQTGFRPRYVLIKSTTVAYSWLILDSVRNPYNLTTQVIYADSTVAEMTNNGTGTGGYESIDILSNGFQIKSNSSRYNQSGQTYIYCAFAETPSINLYGAQANAR